MIKDDNSTTKVSIVNKVPYVNGREVILTPEQTALVSSKRQVPGLHIFIKTSKIKFKDDSENN